MCILNDQIMGHVNTLIKRYPQLALIKESIVSAYLVMEECYKHDGKLLIAGNGGSAADSEHIVGELMKKFTVNRCINPQLEKKLVEIDSVRGNALAQKLECALMAISLTNHDALSTAYANDVDGLMVFAQQLFGYGRMGDVFLAISTSGNSPNILYAAVLAKALGINIIGLTGESGGELAYLADVAVKIPASETYMVQELHVPVYHCWCMMLEERFFNKN